MQNRLEVITAANMSNPAQVGYVSSIEIATRCKSLTESSPFTGPIFEILAGPERKSFQAHASILSKSKSKTSNSRRRMEGEHIAQDCIGRLG